MDTLPSFRFDEEAMAFIMELLDSHELLQKRLFEAPRCTRLGGVLNVALRTESC